MSKRHELCDAPERRSISTSDFDIRKNGDSLALDGYASVFDHEYPVMGGAPRGWTESVDRRAFDATLAAKPDLHLLINHEGMPLARTKSGTLVLSTDQKGLRVQAPNLDRRDPDVQRLEVKMQRGDMDEMSFAFRVKRDDWSDAEDNRRLLEVSLHKGDVSVVNFGASDATSAQMNSLQDALRFLAEVDDSRALAELRSLHLDGAQALERARAKLAALDGQVRPARSRSGRLSVADALAISDGIRDVDKPRRERRADIPAVDTSALRRVLELLSAADTAMDEAQPLLARVLGVPNPDVEQDAEMGEGRAQVSTADRNNLPDSAFAYIEPGGSKDSEGKTVPRSKRHFLIIDAAHVRDALARIAQGAEFGKEAKPAVLAAAKKFGIDVSGH